MISDALNTEGCALASTGGDWHAPLSEALRLAVPAGLPEQAGRAFTNIAGIYCEQRRFGEAERVYAEGVAYCEEHDIGTYATCLRGGRALALEQTGHWDEAAALGGQLLAIVASPVNRLNALLALDKIRARRADAGAWESLDEAAAAADGTGESQWIVLVRLARAEARWLEGKPELARAEAELACDAAADASSWDRGGVACWLRRCGLVILCKPCGSGIVSHRGGVAWAWRWNPAPSAAPRGWCRRVGVLVVVTSWFRRAARGRCRPLVACPSGRWPTRPGRAGEGAPCRLGAGRGVRFRVGPVFDRSRSAGSGVMTAVASVLSVMARMAMVPARPVTVVS